jgi:hypothetical protein
MNKLFAYLLFFNIIFSAFAQKEELVPFKFHPRMNRVTNQQFQQKKANQRVTAISLPFFDDFYQNEIYPNPSLWQDNFVFINSTYPKETITVGVATFDGTDANGIPYDSTFNASQAALAFPADKLTSNPIDLAGLTADSNVYLSFYYLIGDFGETPSAPNDLLTVQFLDSVGNWNIMWQKTADPILKMRQVFIKVDSSYLHSNFQFRFQSFGNITGANDTWHIDYVKLDKNRDTAADRNIKEMAYEFLPPSILKKYYVMPYYQFDSTELADTVNLLVRNNFFKIVDCQDFYTATDVATSTNLSSYTGPSINLDTLSINTFQYPKFNVPTNLTGDTVVVKIDYSFFTSSEAGESAKVIANNAVTHNQVFSNYYAYDDGTPERGYWLRDLDLGKMAVKYNVKTPDTLQAIKFQIFPVVANNALATFSVCVWKNFRRRGLYSDNDLIYKQSGLKLSNLIKEFGVDTLNGFYYAPIRQDYVLNGASFPLIVQDTFAVGLIVDTKNTFTIGFDRNNNRSQYNFYVDDLTKWTESTEAGTMIINPVVGKRLPDYLTVVSAKENYVKNYEVKIYPNPARDQLFIDGVKERCLIQIFSLNGSLIQQQELAQSNFISINELPAAAYVIKITNLQTKQFGTAKFLKSE